MGYNSLLERGTSSAFSKTFADSNLLSDGVLALAGLVTNLDSGKNRKKSPRTIQNFKGSPMMSENTVQSPATNTSGKPMTPDSNLFHYRGESFGNNSVSNFQARKSTGAWVNNELLD